MVIKHQPIDQVCIKLILNKICKDEYSKSTFIRESHGIAYSCKHNLYPQLQDILNYLQDFTTPFFEGINNSLILAVNAKSTKCVDLILDSIRDKAIKNRLIEACNTANENSLMRAINVRSDNIIQLIFQHHSNIDAILGEAFIYALKHSNVDFAKKMLDKASNRSKILNHRTEWGRSALNIRIETKI